MPAPQLPASKLGKKYGFMGQLKASSSTSDEVTSEVRGSGQLAPKLGYHFSQQLLAVP